LSKGDYCYMRSYKKWATNELQYIKDNINQYNDKDLAEKMSQMTGEVISTSMIRRQRRKLGIAKKRGRPSKNDVVSHDIDNV
jgi:hypothetical protein